MSLMKCGILRLNFRVVARDKILVRGCDWGTYIHQNNIWPYTTQPLGRTGHELCPSILPSVVLMNAIIPTFVASRLAHR